MIKVYHLKQPEGGRPWPETFIWTLYYDLQFGKIENMQFKEVPDKEGCIDLVVERTEGETIATLGYEFVAGVFTENLNEVYELTNTIDSPWYIGNKVHPVHMRGYRSTSVGDIVRTEDGKYHIVAKFGFEEIPSVAGFVFKDVKT